MQPVVAAAPEMTSMKSKAVPLAKRLSDALGRIREVEKVSILPNILLETMAHMMILHTMCIILY